MATSLLKLNTARVLQNAVNQSVTDIDARQVLTCLAATRQKVAARFTGSNVQISGNLQLAQDAAAALSCVRDVENSATIRKELKAKISAAMSQAAENAGLFDGAGVNRTDLEQNVINMVETRVDASIENRCELKIDQSIDVSVLDSVFSVGNCSVATIDAASKACDAAVNAASRLAIAGRDSTRFEALMETQCGNVTTCTNRTGDLLVQQGVEASAGCNDIQKLGVDVAELFDASASAVIDQSAGGFDSLRNLIIAGGAVAVLLGLIGLGAQKFKADAQKRAEKTKKGRRRSRGGRLRSNAVIQNVGTQRLRQRTEGSNRDARAYNPRNVSKPSNARRRQFRPRRPT